MSREIVLVAAATWDYIQILETRHPGRAVFFTQAAERRKAPFWAQVPEWEFLFEEEDWRTGLTALVSGLAANRLQPAGVTCFDCESLALAAEVALKLRLPYVSPGAVRHCADKAWSKQTMLASGLCCPDARLVETPAQITGFMARCQAPVVVKPVNGTGSQGVDLCRLPEQAEPALNLASAWNHTGRHEAVVENRIPGPEYSCDFILNNGSLRLIRVAAKFKPQELDFGVSAGYLVTGPGVSGLDETLLCRELKRACRVLGLDRTIGMADFIWHQGHPWFLEITPRSGGDCLPWVIEAASGLDMWGLNLDFALGREIELPRPERWSTLAGLRLLARHEGLVTSLDSTRLAADRRVLQVHLTRGEGHRITLPPKDYDSRQLGHLVFRPSGPQSFEQDCRELAELLDCRITPGPAGMTHLSGQAVENQLDL